jgi:hypothetical protein
MKSRRLLSLGCLVVALAGWPAVSAAQDVVPPFEELLAKPVVLKPGLGGVHPRVFVTKGELEQLRQRARTTHREEWQKVLANLVALKKDPDPAPGSQERRAQNNVALAMAGVSLAAAIEQQPQYVAAAKKYVLAAIDYEPWGYSFDKPNTDLAAAHLLYSIGWSYDLLYDQFTPAERARIKTSLERHAGLVYDAFAPKPGKTFAFTQNHNFIPTAGLAVAALALMGESADAPKWAALARAHHHRAGQLLSPDGHFFEGMEYWVFSATWLVRFLDAWEHCTGENLWERGQFRNWKYYIAHVVLPDGQTVFDFGDIWQGPLTRAKQGDDYAREYPTGTLKSNYNVLYRVAARLKDPESQAVAERLKGFGHTNQEEWWTLLWRDEGIKPAAMSSMPLAYHFEDSGYVFYRTSWEADATAFAFRAGPPEGHRVTRLLAKLPEWRLSSGHAHPDNGSFIIWARGRYLVGDTGYAGQPQARHHNTVVIGGIGQGDEGDHDVWRKADQRALDTVRVASAQFAAGSAKIEADIAGAYGPLAGATRVHRTFTFTAPGTFAVSDVIETKDAKPVEWFLHADTPVETEGARYLFGVKPAQLAVGITAPAGAKVTTGATTLMAPGRPGSITSGPQQQRGYELKVETAPATVTKIEATLSVVR